MVTTENQLLVTMGKVRLIINDESFLHTEVPPSVVDPKLDVSMWPAVTR